MVFTPLRDSTLDQTVETLHLTLTCVVSSENIYVIPLNLNTAPQGVGSITFDRSKDDIYLEWRQPVGWIKIQPSVDGHTRGVGHYLEDGIMHITAFNINDGGPTNTQTAVVDQNMICFASSTWVISIKLKHLMHVADELLFMHRGIVHSPFMILCIMYLHKQILIAFQVESNDEICPLAVHVELNTVQKCVNLLTITGWTISLRRSSRHPHPHRIDTRPLLEMVEMAVYR
ncbi:hypothetical protein BJ138DRAFT_5823 [Hygrophoropsis aurantiaca]|uniref:Uncharacterized protein n=1 Tax=Hygrophoropsis aurantiaca TaxID=72124 RepID=A0ACB8AU56_9AGAM|nr:hypothetical protein BJ138DRAFT_5823 [Hygrophoropsis aurantiaca]